MSQLYTQATKCINEYVEHYGGNWKEIRRQVLLDLDYLHRHGSDGAKQFALTLDLIYQHMKPEGTP